MGQPLAAIGTQFQVGNGAAPEVFTTVARCVAINPPAFTTDVLDATAHDSPDDTEEVVVGIKRNGDLETSLQLVPDDPTHDETTGLLSLQQSRAKTNFRWVFPDASSTVWQIAGYVIGFSPAAPVDGVLTFSCRIKPTGVPTFNPI